jgi:hypothetical protein
MPTTITDTKFCGASVTSIQSQAGFQEQSSDLLVNVVEDPSQNDIYTSPAKGTPLSFTFGGFYYAGIVQNDAMRRDTSGNPVYTVRLGSPSSLIEGVQVVLDGYIGMDLVCPNFLGVYGYLERGGNNFGGSQKNESGIPYYLVAQAITAIQDGTTAYSTGISFYGYQYIVRMDQLPNAPSFYRMGGGVVMSLMQIIQTLCQDAGYDFMITMTILPNGVNEIGFKLRSRLIQYPLGQIQAFVNGRDDVVSYDSGSEFRADITNGVLIGGNIEELVVQQDLGNFQTIKNFWGYQNSTLLVPFGTQGNLPIVTDANDPSLGNQYTVNLNASAIGDIIGDGTNFPIYPCSIMEMRMAMMDFDSWSAYVVRNRTDLTGWLGIPAFPSVITDNLLPDPFPQALFTNNLAGLSILTDVYQGQPVMAIIERIYDFVRSTADTYMGRQYLVRIPFALQYYFESETNKLFYNLDPTSEAYWPDYLGGFGVGPAGLFYNNFNFFSSNDSKFTPFVYYNNFANANVGSRGQNGYVLQPNGIYSSCSIEPQIIFTPAPAVVININEPLWSRVLDPVGGIADMANFLGLSFDQMIQILDMRNGEFPIRIHPYAINPTIAAIPMKSNQTTYGPWVNLGIDGPVKVVQDVGLVPWNYGGFDVLNQAATEQLADIGSTNHIEESGSVTLAGLPLISLGDSLVSAGPIVTSIDITIDPQSGLTTIYRMKSQTPVFGAFSKQNAERLRRLGSATQELRRSMRSLFTRANEISQIIANATDYQPFFRISGAINQNQTNVMQGFMFTDPLTGEVFPIVNGMNFKGALGGANVFNQQNFMKMGNIGMEGIFRPFTTNINLNGLAKMQIKPNLMINEDNPPQLIQDDMDNPPDPNPTSDVINPTAMINADALNPYVKGHDMLWMSHGDNFSGFYTKGSTSGMDTIDYDNLRLMGLRGPISIVGWGRDLLGQPVPNKVPDSGGTIPIQNLDPSSYFIGQPPSGYQDEFAEDEFDDGTEPSGAMLSSSGVSYLRRSDTWKAGPLDAMWDKFRGVWTFPGIMTGTIISQSGILASGSMSGMSGVVSSGVLASGFAQLDDYPDIFPVYNQLGGTFIPAGTAIYFGYAPLKNKWMILAAACPSGT